MPAITLEVGLDTGRSGRSGCAPGTDRTSCAAGGQPVDLHVSGSRRGLPAGLDLAAYRVVQEGLTNVMKHAGQAKTTVTVDYGATMLVIEVADDGRRNPSASPAGPGAIPGTGRGLIGLRERVTMYSGDFDAGRRPGGGWRIHARIPLDPQPAGPPAMGTDEPADPARREPVTTEPR